MRATQFTAPIVGHGEGPLWTPEDGLRICDGYEGGIVSIDASGQVTDRVRVGSFVGAFRPRVGGGTVAAAERSFVLIDPDGTVRDLGDVWSDTNLRMNDGGCDPQGRFYCGSMAYDGTPKVGILYRLNLDGSVTEVLDQLSTPNGMAYTADGSTVFHIDTPTRLIRAFDVDDSGEWTNGRAVVSDISPGSPDGMTIDADGNVWVALWGGAGVRCFDPRTGSTLEVIDVDGPVQTSACTFGGDNLDQLFITTSTQGGKGGPQAGSVFLVEPGVRGVPALPYAG